MHNHSYPVPVNEAGRLKALYEYDLLDSLSEKEYDFITTMASQICNTPVSLITLIDKNRQWMKSKFGFDISETPREWSFCNYTILDAGKVNVVPDMRLDDRYCNNPLVAGEPHAVFYAGAPLVTPGGFVLGSICVLDAKAKSLTAEQEDALKALATQTITTMELRKKNKHLKIAQQNLQKTNKQLKEYVKLVSHDMKTPLANISMLSRVFRNNYQHLLDEESGGCLELIEQSAGGLLGFIDDLLKKSAANGGSKKPGRVNTLKVLDNTLKLLAPPGDIEINVTGNFPTIPIDKTALQQVFQNLITNAIKYNDKPRGIINIVAGTNQECHFFQVSDNGTGIAGTDISKIFSERQTLNKTDRYGNKGTGIGLAKVKSIVEAAGGSIRVESRLKKGTHFTISLPLYPGIAKAI